MNPVRLAPRLTESDGVKPVLLLLLAAATALATAAAIGECSACANPRFGLAGAAFYASMFAAGATFGPTRPVALALFAAFGFHAGLVASGAACALCLATAACSAAIALLLLRDHAPALATAPFTAALGLALAVPPSPDAEVTVYEQDGCPYCEELRERVMPEATRGLPVRVRYRPATAAIRTTPTIVIGRRVIEGVPPVDVLRRAILEGGSP